MTFLWAGTCLHAQTASDLNSGLTLSYDTALNEISVDWWAKSSFFYFILETEDLVDDPWTYFPYAVLGSDAVEGIALTSNAPMMFFRLERTNDANSPVLQLDLDGDLVGAGDELLQGTDPFLSQSMDGDTIPDDWELFHGLDTTTGVDSSADDEEPDGSSNASEFAANSDPNYRDHPDLILTLH